MFLFLPVQKIRRKTMCVVGLPTTTRSAATEGSEQRIAKLFFEWLISQRLFFAAECAYFGPIQDRFVVLDFAWR